MSEERIQHRLREISEAFASLNAARSRISSTHRYSVQLVKGADHSARSAEKILGGSATGADKKIASNLRSAAENGQIFQKRLDEVEHAMRMKQKSLADERAQLKEELRRARQARAQAQRGLR